MARETVNNRAVDIQARGNGAGPVALSGTDVIMDLSPEAARETLADATGFISPQRFYREATKREDVRRILDALAK
jgi:hypothetical protein